MYDTYQNKTVISANLLWECGVMTRSNYDKLVGRGKIKVLKPGRGQDNHALVDVQMPERFQRIMKNVFGDPKDVTSKNALDEFLGQDTAAIEFFSSYEIDDNRYLPTETINEYYANACVLNAIHLLLNSRRSLQKMCGGSVKAYWPTIAKNVLDLDREQYPHSLPMNDRRLKDRYNQYQKGGYEVLIHRNFCNKNSAKVNDKDKESVIVELLASPNNLDNAQVAKFYNMIAEKAGWKQITPATVANWREEYDTMIYAGRRGSVAFRNKKTMQVKRSAPSAPMFFWTLDGWDAELLYQKREGNRTTYHNRPCVVVVLDAFNKYPVGYAVGTNETPELIQMALRNAAKHTAELFGTMYRTHQIQSDRYAVKMMTPFYETLGKHYTPARARNAKAKIIEPYFNYINRNYCQLQPNWSGFGITSDPEKQPNVEFKNMFKKHFPDFADVCRQIDIMIMAERANKAEAYIKGWNGLANKDKIELPYNKYLLQFGSTTGRGVLMQNNGLISTINGVKHTYDCFDTSFRNHSSVKWNIMYDTDDMTRALAINEDATLQYIVEEKYIQPMALKDRKDGDSEQLERVRRYNKQLESNVTEFRAMSVENASEFIGMLPQFETLKKMCITDSKGQHKSVRNSAKSLPTNNSKKDIKTPLRPISINATQAEVQSTNIWDKI